MIMTQRSLQDGEISHESGKQTQPTMKSSAWHAGNIFISILELHKTGEVR